MAKAFLVSINLNGNELQNAVMQPLAVAPSSPKYGQMYLDSTTNMIKLWDGSAWTAVGAVVSVNGKTGVVVLTQDDVGDGSTYKRTHNDLTDALVALINGALPKSGGTMSGNIAMGGNAITGLAAPSSNTDAATKKYADDLVAGLGAVFKFKGTKADTSSLPLSGNSQGDVWLVTADSSEYVWTLSASSGTIAGWEKLGVTVDLSGYAPLASPAFTGTPTAPSYGYVNPLQIINWSTLEDELQKHCVRSNLGTISTSQTSVTVSVSGAAVYAYAMQNGDYVMVDIHEGTIDPDTLTTPVTFSVASAPSSPISCYVISVKQYWYDNPS